MNQEEFMNQKVSEMTISELANAIRIKHRKIYEKIVPKEKPIIDNPFFDDLFSYSTSHWARMDVLLKQYNELAGKIKIVVEDRCI